MNFWAYLHINGDGYDIAVADAGATDLAANLKKTCHIALYGMLFDFNKSTLQPASDAVLRQVADLLAKDKTLKIEVQGHTDNVGGDAYNQTLSEARARAMADWLIKRSVAGERLSAHGYGKTKPMADNNSDEGRTKNGRVEITDPACAPAPASPFVMQIIRLWMDLGRDRLEHEHHPIAPQDREVVISVFGATTLVENVERQLGLIQRKRGAQIVDDKKRGDNCSTWRSSVGSNITYVRKQ